MSTYDSNTLYRPLNTNANNGGFSLSICNWFKHIKVYKILCLILILMFIVPMLAHYFILNVSNPMLTCRLSEFVSLTICFYYQVESDISDSDAHRSRSQLDAYEDFSSLRASDLKLRIEEMLRIKVNTEFITNMSGSRIYDIFYVFRAPYRWSFAN